MAAKLTLMPGVTYNQFGSGMKHKVVSPRLYVTKEIAANTIGTSDKYRIAKMTRGWVKLDLEAVNELVSIMTVACAE